MRSSPQPSVRPSILPLLSKYPRLAPVISVLPFVSTVRPGEYDLSNLTSIAPRASAETGPDGAPGSPRQPRAARARSLLRRAALPSTAVAIAIAAFALGRGAFVGHQAARRGAGAAALKTTESGGHVRWQRDAIDVVIDKSFAELAGPAVFGAAVDAWRATGAEVPSISTKPGESKQVGYNPLGPNENVVVFAPYGWQKAHGALAVTVLTFEDTSGAIVDADVLVNGGGRFFANFDVDQSDEADGDTLIEDATSASSSSQKTTGKTFRYDTQSVITHELGHFLGLGEDYDESKATMYTKTRAGEIHKRRLTTADQGVITALYAESSGASQASRSGCGGAHLARGEGVGGSTWLGFAAVTLGLGLLAASRRASGERLVVRVTPRQVRRRRWLGHLGTFLTVGGLSAFLAPPDVRAATDESAPRGDAEVEIVGASPHWVDGLLETDLTFRVTTCHVANCPDGNQHALVAGGKLGGVTQLVGPFAVPERGVRRHVALRDARGLMKTLRTTFQP